MTLGKKGVGRRVVKIGAFIGPNALIDMRVSNPLSISPLEKGKQGWLAVMSMTGSCTDAMAKSSIPPLGREEVGWRAVMILAG